MYRLPNSQMIYKGTFDLKLIVNFILAQKITDRVQHVSNTSNATSEPIFPEYRVMVNCNVSIKPYSFVRDF